jgi:hypothetical protein
MNDEPATKEDIAKLEASIEGMRAQNSAEHGSLFTKLLRITELMTWLKAKWERFIGPDEPGPPPPKRD